MIGLRVALGILEAGLYPSVVYLLATWYSRCMSTLSHPCFHADHDAQMMSANDTALSTSLAVLPLPLEVS